MFKSFMRQLVCVFITAPLASQSIAAEIEKLHFLIPGTVGGGWDNTARGIGDVLVKEEIVDQVSFKNLSGRRRW